MNRPNEVFIRRLMHPVKFRMYLLTRLPSAYFSGLRLKDLDPSKSLVTVPYTWFSKNPFRSTYFACLAMAAEMSTGVLALVHTHERKPSVSMLVVNLQAAFFKKATGRTSFRCEDGLLIGAAVEKAVASGQGQTVVAKSMGTNQAGEKVAEFLITWSFKARSRPEA
jgi:Domain of unknown function (DUF4442)